MSLTQWEAPAVVLSVSPYGEGHAVVRLLTEAHGRYCAMVRGGGSRRQAALWQVGQIVLARWSARLPDQLGTLTGEVIEPVAAKVMASRFLLTMLSSVCAMADGALAERERHTELAAALLSFVSFLGHEPDKALTWAMSRLLHWEMLLLKETGYGLDLSCCAVSGQRHGLCWVSPRTGRAVSDASAGPWRARLLALPPLMLDSSDAGDAQQWRHGLYLTGHFLARNVFGHKQHRLPAARMRLYDIVERMAERKR